MCLASGSFYVNIGIKSSALYLGCSFSFSSYILYCLYFWCTASKRSVVRGCNLRGFRPLLTETIIPPAFFSPLTFIITTIIDIILVVQMFVINIFSVPLQPHQTLFSFLFLLISDEGVSCCYLARRYDDANDNDK